MIVLSRDVKPQTETGESPGDSRVLDLPQQTTKLYVGGIPATSIVSGLEVVDVGRRGVRVKKQPRSVGGMSNALIVSGLGV